MRALGVTACVREVTGSKLSLTHYSVHHCTTVSQDRRHLGSVLDRGLAAALGAKYLESGELWLGGRWRRGDLSQVPGHLHLFQVGFSFENKMGVGGSSLPQV